MRSLSSVASARRSAVDLHEVPPVVGALVDGAQDVDDARLVLGRMEQLLQRAHGLRPRAGRRPAGTRSTTACSSSIPACDSPS